MSKLLGILYHFYRFREKILMDTNQIVEGRVLKYEGTDMILESISAMMGIETMVMVETKTEILKKGLHENNLLMVLLIDLKLQDQREDCSV